MECENERGWWRVGTGPQGVSRSLGVLPLSLPVISLASRKKKKRKKKGKEKKKSPNNELRARAHRRARSSFIQTGNRARPGM